MKYRIKHVIEYAAVRGSVWFVRALPYHAALLGGWLIAFFGYRVLRFRRKLALARLKEVFGADMPPSRMRKTAWLSWRNFVFCVVDMIRLPNLTRAWIASHVLDHEASLEVMRRHCASGRGAILACPHMGAWEMAGAVMQSGGVPIFFITGRQKNPLVDAYLNRLRGSTGIETVQRGSSMLRGVIRKLKSGMVLGFLPDVRSLEEGVRIGFLGKEANVVAGMGLFAHHADVPIFPSIVTRIGWSRHRIEFREPVRPDPNAGKREDWRRMTQQVFDRIEEAVRQYPEQWFWFNKRWILDPMEEGL